MGLGVTALAGACSAPSAACSIAVPPPDRGAARLASVFALFRAWWDRTDDAFYDIFDGKRLPTAEGRSGRARWLAEAGEAPRRLFENVFVDEGMPREMQVITLLDDLAFVSVVEHSPGGVGPDCSGMPRAHRFLLTFKDKRLQTLQHLGSDTTTAGGQITHWSAGP